MKNKVFEANPSLDCYFQTTDGECFFTENAAKDHARSLADKTVKPFHRADFVQQQNIQNVDENQFDETGELTGKNQPEGTTEEVEEKGESVNDFELVDEVNLSEELKEQEATVKPVAKTKTTKK